MKVMIKFCSLLLVSLLNLHITEVHTKDVLDNDKGLYGDDFGDSALKKHLERIATSLERLPMKRIAISLKRIGMSGLI